MEKVSGVSSETLSCCSTHTHSLYLSREYTVYRDHNLKSGLLDIPQLHILNFMGIEIVVLVSRHFVGWDQGRKTTTTQNMT